MSGVGKTTLINGFIAEHPEVVRISGGDLLLIGKSLEPKDYDFLRLSKMDEILHNQDLIVSGLRKYRDSNPFSQVLFDGHSAVSNDEEVVEVPSYVIAGLELVGIVFVEDDAAAIVARRRSDTTRQRAFPSLDLVEREQTIARRACERYSHELGIAVLRVRSGMPVVFSSEVSSLLLRR